MKKLSILCTLLLANMATQASAATVAGIEGVSLLSSGDSVTGTNNFLNYTSANSADIISGAQLQADLTDTDYSTYVLSTASTAYVDVTLNSSSFYNGEGNDLVFFFVGNVDSSNNVVINFDLSINGITNNYLPQITPVETSVSDSYGTYTLTAASINLDDFGLDYAAQDSLTSLRVLLGTSNSANYPALSMIGGFHTSPMVVPLPLPIILFTSGLGMLGWFGRRKSL